MKVFVISFVAVIVVIVTIAIIFNFNLTLSAGSKIPLSFSYQSSGVAFEVYVNGKLSKLLSSESLNSSTGVVPANLADFKTHPGENELTVKVVDIAPDSTPFLDLVVDTYQKGDVIEAGTPSSKNPLLVEEITAPQLKKNAQLKFTFNVQ